MIIVTGAAGFIGSALISKLNKQGFKDIVLVDDFSFEKKNFNFKDKTFTHKVEREQFFDWLKDKANLIQIIVHLGARTDTAEFDMELLNHLNTDYSKKVWNYCVQNSIPLVYASSAATYGIGNKGFSDSHNNITPLEPLNPYGISKQVFDLWVMEQEKTPPFWAGIKFFNVYGPNEYHKARMASVVLHAYRQINKTGGLKLFRSHNPDYKNGEQTRDFVYIKDVVNVLLFMIENRKNSGIYNLGSGITRTFMDLGKAVFKAMAIKENINFIDTPIDIRDKYQYYTLAKMDKLKSIGYNEIFTTLEDGVDDYVGYLKKGTYY